MKTTAATVIGKKKMTYRLACMALATLMQFGIAVNAQIRSGLYTSGYHIELKWDFAQKKYATIKTMAYNTPLQLSASYIGFKKQGNATWKYNSWTHKGELPGDRTVASDWYMDERGQKIVIDYDQKKLLYYHEYSDTYKKYLRLTTYCNLRYVGELPNATSPTDEDNAPSNDEDPSSFRVDVTRVCFFDVDKDEWSDWKESDNTFIINYNDSQDILHIRPNGKRVLYRRVSKAVERKETSDGKKYQIISAIDEDGITFQFQIFDNRDYGIKLIYRKTIVQFSNP
ncbi:MAG: hypothetical protein EAY75_10185 [Bacteroidetes bacterium]|nr:MAG: hypothetical protein EAY75_10185 [Bacteroidota bacterium]